MVITNVFMIELIGFVPSWLITQPLVMSLLGTLMEEVFGILLVNKDGTGRIGFAIDQTLAIVGVSACGRQLT